MYRRPLISVVPKQTKKRKKKKAQKAAVLGDILAIWAKEKPINFFPPRKPENLAVEERRSMIIIIIARH